MDDLEELEDNGVLDESVISETKRQILEKVEAISEKTKRMNDEMRARIAEIKKPYLDSAKSISQELEKSISERNNE